MADLRSGNKQLSDELHASYTRMNDPEVHEAQERKKQRENFVADLEDDAGV